MASTCGRKVRTSESWLAIRTYIDPRSSEPATSDARRLVIGTTTRAAVENLPEFPRAARLPLCIHSTGS